MRCETVAIVFFAPIFADTELNSHCACLDNHEHARLLPMRQVQPGLQPGRKRL
jgi:hypothetical protein